MTVETISKADVIQPSALMTGEQLFSLGNLGRTELLKGRVVHLPPAEYLHGIVECHLATIVGNFVHQHKPGHVLSGGVGIYTQRNPDTVRGADVAYISKERLAQTQSKSFLDVAPELIVEVLSPGDRWTEVIEKLDEYFEIDVQAVWIADPVRQEVFVYHSLTKVERFTTDDNLPGGTVLPGFEAAVSEFFGVSFDE